MSSSADSRSGFPPVATWQAAQNSSSASEPSAPRTSAAADASDSAASWIETVAGIGDELGQQELLGRLLRRARRGDDEQRQALEPARR